MLHCTVLYCTALYFSQLTLIIDHLNTHLVLIKDLSEVESDSVAGGVTVIGLPPSLVLFLMTEP